MKPEPQIFTLEEANSLVPQLRTLVGQQLARRADIEDRLKSLAEATGEMPTEIAPPEPNDTPAVRELKQELLERIGRYQEAWSEVERLGAVVKDPRVGLVDFYGHVEGKAVWLCWKYRRGRDRALPRARRRFRSARKPIGASIKRRLLN